MSKLARGYKTFFMLNLKPNMKFIMLINVKLSTIVGILTFMSMMNTTSESLRARKIFIFQHFRCYDYLKFHAQLSMKKDLYSWPV